MQVILQQRVHIGHPVLLYRAPGGLYKFFICTFFTCISSETTCVAPMMYGSSVLNFSDKHPYYPDSCAACPYSGNKLMALFHDLAGGRKHCNSCRKVEKVMKDAREERTELVKQRKKEYMAQYRDNPDYKDVKFNKKTGAIMATHKSHIEHSAKNEETFFGEEKLTSTMLEKECQKELFRMGNKAVLENENEFGSDNNQLAALDLNLNGKMADIASITSNSNRYSYTLYRKNGQLQRYNAREDVEEKADALVLHFHDPSFFSEEKMQKSINTFKYWRNSKGEPIERHLKTVHCVIKGADNAKTYTIK